MGNRVNAPKSPIKYKLYSDLSDFYGASTLYDPYVFDCPIMYAGQYYDHETGLYYLRARYYSPDLCRFTSEDPIKDGLNWYAYCAGNPVMFYDPWGLTILLSGTASEMGVILRDLQELTDNTLELRAILDSEGVSTDQYEVFISEYSDTINYASGNELIGRMITNEHTTTISMRYGEDSSTVHYTSENAQNGIGVNSYIFLDSLQKAETYEIQSMGNVIKGIAPFYIILAHELIHADRLMRGEASDYNAFEIVSTPVGIKYDPSSRWKGPILTYILQRVRQEELATVGLGYNNKNDITENMIRKEHALKLRGAY